MLCNSHADYDFGDVHEPFPKRALVCLTCVNPSPPLPLAARSDTVDTDSPRQSTINRTRAGTATWIIAGSIDISEYWTDRIHQQGARTRLQSKFLHDRLTQRQRLI
ncbi:unnamed protein product [Mortierella alpina]